MTCYLIDIVSWFRYIEWTDKYAMCRVVGAKEKIVLDIVL